MKNLPIQKYFVDKAVAEKEFGFSLYQGGIVPGNVLRIVQIEETDTEACCGTHCDFTSEIGWVRILKSAKIQDGIVRLYFVAGRRTMDKLNYDTGILNDLCRIWSIDKGQLVKTGERFFKEYKKLTGELSEKVNMVLNLQMRYVLDNDKQSVAIKSDEQSASLYFSHLSKYAQEVKDKQKGVLFVGDNFLFGLFSSEGMIDVNELKSAIKKEKDLQVKALKAVQYVNPQNKKKSKVDGIL